MIDSILDKWVLLDITRLFKFFNEFFLNTSDSRQGLSEIVRLLVIELHNPWFTVIEVHLSWWSFAQSESLDTVSDWAAEQDLMPREEIIIVWRLEETIWNNNMNITIIWYNEWRE